MSLPPKKTFERKFSNPPKPAFPPMLTIDNVGYSDYNSGCIPEPQRDTQNFIYAETYFLRLSPISSLNYPRPDESHDWIQVYFHPPTGRIVWARRK